MFLPCNFNELDSDIFNIFINLIRKIVFSNCHFIQSPQNLELVYLLVLHRIYVFNISTSYPFQSFFNWITAKFLTFGKIWWDSHGVSPFNRCVLLKINSRLVLDRNTSWDSMLLSLIVSLFRLLLFTTTLWSDKSLKFNSTINFSIHSLSRDIHSFTNSSYSLECLKLSGN